MRSIGLVLSVWCVLLDKSCLCDACYWSSLGGIHQTGLIICWISQMKSGCCCWTSFAFLLTLHFTNCTNVTLWWPLTSVSLQYGRTPLHMAAINGLLEVVRHLCVAGANTDVVTNVRYLSNKARGGVAYGQYTVPCESIRPPWTLRPFATFQASNIKI